MSVESLQAHSVKAAWSQYDAVDAGPTGLNAFLSVDRDGSLAAATAIGTTGDLARVPVAIKDNLATLVLPTTCGSRILQGYVSPYEATAVRKLREAGAIVIGKTNMDEFAMGSSIAPACREGPPAVLRRPSLPASSASRSVPKRVAPYDNPPPFAGSSG
jgi:aspartyl-tRNA(Asn)/glutamyl-tRNA(Gln) amidotransferase subunit A